MLRQVTDGVLVHESDFCQSNAVIVQGQSGVLLIDAGITATEMDSIAHDLHEMGQAVAVGFSTHPHWDHLLWHDRFGSVPRYGTSLCAAAIKNVLSSANWRDRVTGMLPPEIASDIPLDNLFGQITGLPVGTSLIPWDGPKVRIIEHQAHAAGHAALLVEESRVLLAGDMLSNLLVPILNFAAGDPVGDYLAALRLLEDEANSADLLIPGHGSTAGADQLLERIEQDRSYVQALRNNVEPNDPRLSRDWVLEVHRRQVQQFAQLS